MEGSSTEASKGIIPRTFEQIFNSIQCSENLQFLVRASFLEVYNEEIRDLLSKVRCPGCLLPKIAKRRSRAACARQ